MGKIYTVEVITPDDPSDTRYVANIIGDPVDNSNGPEDVNDPATYKKNTTKKVRNFFPNFTRKKNAKVYPLKVEMSQEQVADALQDTIDDNTVINPLHEKSQEQVADAVKDTVDDSQVNTSIREENQAPPAPPTERTQIRTPPAKPVTVEPVRPVESVEPVLKIETGQPGYVIQQKELGNRNQFGNSNQIGGKNTKKRQRKGKRNKSIRVKKWRFI